jgi:hypothetical protein
LVDEQVDMKDCDKVEYLVSVTVVLTAIGMAAGKVSLTAAKKDETKVD